MKGFQKGELHHAWKGGRRLDKDGYVLVKAKGHPLAQPSTGYAYEHRLVAAEVWGVEAVKGKVVHHKNGVVDDNRPENLELISQSSHARGHTKGKKRPGWHGSERDTDTGKFVKQEG